MGREFLQRGRMGPRRTVGARDGGGGHDLGLHQIEAHLAAAVQLEIDLWREWAAPSSPAEP
jgi:hypothetical protein